MDSTDNLSNLYDFYFSLKKKKQFKDFNWDKFQFFS